MGKVFCEICKKRCRGNVLKVSNSFFHKDCFRCTKCNCKLEFCGFFQKDDKYFCQKDYRNIISKCKVCGETIDDEAVSAFSHSFHKSCFICNVCKCSFNPGDKVTVWKEKFFCISCSLSRDSDDRSSAKHRLSFANQTESPRPTELRSNVNGLSDPAVISDLETPTNCSNLNGLKPQPKILKSSLRTSANHQTMLSSDCEYSNPVPDITDVPQFTRNDYNTLSTNSSAYLTRMQRSQTVGPGNATSIYNSGRHQLSDYGRFYNSSYLNISALPFRRGTDSYQRSGTNTPSLSSSVSKLHHFHIPEGPSRYGDPRNGHAFPSSLGDAIVKMNEPVIRKANCTAWESKYDHDSTDAFSKNGFSQNTTPRLLSRKIQTLNDSDISLGESVTPTHRKDRDANFEARRLANFPAGQPPDANTSPAIERYDWPAPASSAVLMAEMMRDRRHREREQCHLNRIQDDVDSLEDLSLNISLDSSSEIGFGIGRAILLEDEEVKRRKFKSRHALDPISSSRTPNASSEPSYKTRYDTHSFSGNSTVRPSYTAAESIIPCKKINSSFHETDNSDVNSSHDESRTYQEKADLITQMNGHGLKNGYAPTISKHSPCHANSTYCGLNGAGDNDLHDSGCTVTYPHSMSTSIPESFFSPTSPAPFKEFSYKDLVSLRKNLPRGIDRVKLESYLSDCEFSDIFGLKKVAFYRLPEWKRNDLKRRVQLF